MCCRVIDRAVQIFGAAGVTEDGGLAHGWAWSRALWLADCPDVVHQMSIAKLDRRKYV